MGKARTCAKPVSAICHFEEERERRIWEGQRKWIVERWARRGRQVQFLTVSRWSPVPSWMPGN